ncbi:hypothetical protein MRB53_029810 [Persea americana]|uniref:Uncharacterized protein n=1 Tax=Persea americana TaxID=3435 RepID=A0ACC2KJG2_PERAE|nr:hypothetical protein MRB53_029810 [Persea americana]|eukprot:TRINITY_DN17930_c0_g1_i1.p1 TRINITY_DN17930_c0_g1~~TRINITY_DN17930_c0_g1_i1.p1  ORF type:complete len:279 (+),score=70.63 TRINITY_DN17930_c0_g1_i1:468-1304(+)
MEVVKQTMDPLKSSCNSIFHHKPYKIASKAFEIRVMYMRVVSTSDMQSTMKIIFPSRDLRTCLQINGLRIDPYEKISRSLNRHRADALMYETTYVNTDRIKFNGSSLPFEVQTQESSVIISGVLRREGAGFDGSNDGHCMWVMECEDGEIKEVDVALVDLYIAGRSSGRPVLLNGVLELNKRWKVLSCIREGEETGGDNFKDPEEKVIQEAEDGYYILKQKGEEKMFVEEEEGELSWFNAGVRVGMGLGLGMCLGIGVGVGLVIRTYRATAGAFRKFI